MLWPQSHYNVPERGDGSKQASLPWPCHFSHRNLLKTLNSAKFMRWECRAPTHSCLDGSSQGFSDTRKHQSR